MLTYRTDDIVSTAPWSSRRTNDMTKSSARADPLGSGMVSVRVLEWPLSGGQEARDERDEVLGGGEEPEVAVVADIKGTAGQKRPHDERVDERDHGEVVFGEEQGGSSDEWQGREARPAHAARRWK